MAHINMHSFHIMKVHSQIFILIIRYRAGITELNLNMLCHFFNMNELKVFICRMIHVCPTIIEKILAGREFLHLQLLRDHHTTRPLKEKKMRIESNFLFFFFPCQVSLHRASHIPRTMGPSPVRSPNQ